MSERKIWLEEGLIDASPLSGDGLHVYTPNLSSGFIEHADLGNIIRLAEEKGIVAIPRSLLDPNYLESIRFNLEYPTPVMTRKALYDYWHRTSGSTVRNAMPHLHDDTNIHVAPCPSNQPTAFFSRRAAIAAVECMSRTEDICSQFQEKLRYALDCSLRSDDPQEVFLKLSELVHAERGEDSLRCVQLLQHEVRERGGMLEIPLEKDAYGLIVIPKVLHGRSVLGALTRDDVQTAWRYVRT